MTVSPPSIGLGRTSATNAAAGAAGGVVSVLLGESRAVHTQKAQIANFANPQVNLSVCLRSLRSLLEAH